MDIGSLGMPYNIFFDIAAILNLIIVLFAFLIHKKLPEQKTKTFLFLCVSTLCCAIVDIISALSSDDDLRQIDDFHPEDYDNQLIGYGLVVGLAGTGDKKDSVFTISSIKNMMDKMGVGVKSSALKVAKALNIEYDQFFTDGKSDRKLSGATVLYYHHINLYFFVHLNLRLQYYQSFQS